jgi:DNA-binding MarR family transcriptional regulator
MGKGSGCTPGAMVLTSRLAKQFYRRSDEDLLGMQLRHLVALAYVRDHEGCPQQDLADAFCMDANNVVLLLNELEDLGCVTRLRDPHDRRRHVVELTREGRTALARTERAQGAIEDEVLHSLDASERETLRRLLTRALQGAEAEEDAARQEPEPAGRQDAGQPSATMASIST